MDLRSHWLSQIQQICIKWIAFQRNGITSRGIVPWHTFESGIFFFCYNPESWKLWKLYLLQQEKTSLCNRYINKLGVSVSQLGFGKDNPQGRLLFLKDKNFLLTHFNTLFRNEAICITHQVMLLLFVWLTKL